MRTYILNPNMTFDTLSNTLSAFKPKGAATDGIVEAIAPAPARSQARPLTQPIPPRPLPTPVIDPNKPMLKLGLDVHLLFTMAVAQYGHESPKSPRKFTTVELVIEVKRRVEQGVQVFCVQESCGFGFVLHRKLVEAGAQSFLVTPAALNGKRKTDKLDARALCQRLTRYLDGDRTEICPIRIPTPEEQRRREITRRRQFLKRQIRALANRGHGQLAEYCHSQLPSHWWGARNWKKLSAVLEPWLCDILNKLRELIVALEAQVKELEAQMLQRVAGQPRPKGLGEISLAALDAEMCDWNRFSNRKQAGSYTGCCPGEHSSGGQQRMGSIDRMGNGRVRAILVEAVWRFLKWQPAWKAARKMKVKLAAGSAMRKKTVVALARRLAIDLWRWRTGRATMQDLGWVAA